MAKLVEIFEIKIGGVPTAVRSMNDLENAVKSIEEQLKSADLGSAEFKRLANELDIARGKVNEINEATKGLRLDENVAAGIAAVNGLAGAYTAAIGAAAAFGGANKDVEEQLLKLQSAMAVISGLQALADGVRNSAVAFRVLSAAMSTALGPLGVFVAVLGAVVAGLSIFIKSSKQAAKEQLEFSRAVSGSTKELQDLEKTATSAGAAVFDAYAARRRATLTRLAQDTANYLEIYKGLTEEEVNILRDGNSSQIEELLKTDRLRKALRDEEAKEQIDLLLSTKAEIIQLERDTTAAQIDELQRRVAAYNRLTKATASQASDLATSMREVQAGAIEAAAAILSELDPAAVDVIFGKLKNGAIDSSQALQLLTTASQELQQTALGNDKVAVQLQELTSIAAEAARAQADAVNQYNAELIGLQATLDAVVSSEQAAFEDRAAFINRQADAQRKQAELTVKDAKKLRLQLAAIDAQRGRDLVALAREQLDLQQQLAAQSLALQAQALQDGLAREADYNQLTIDQEVQVLSTVTELQRQGFDIRQQQLDKALDDNIVSVQDYEVQVQQLNEERRQAQLTGEQQYTATLQRETARRLALLQAEEAASEALRNVVAERVAIEGRGAEQATQRRLNALNKEVEQGGLLLHYRQLEKDLLQTTAQQYAQRVAAIEQAAQAQLATIASQQTILEGERALLQAQAQRAQLTDAELARLKEIGTQLQVLAGQADNIQLGVEIDQAQLADEADQASKTLAKELKNQLIQQSLDIAAGIVQTFDTAAQGVQQVLDILNEAADKADQERLDQLAARREEAQSQVDALGESVAALETQIGDQRTARAAAFNEQLNSQQAALATEKAQLRELDKEEERITKRREARERQLAKTQLAIDTARAWGQFAIAIATAAANAAMSGPAAIAVVPATIAAVTAAAVPAIVSTVALAKFSNGGVIDGPSHAQGGVVAMVGGRPTAELEGGEGVLTARVMRNPVLAEIASGINQMAGGVPLAPSRYMAMGGVVPSGTDAALGASMDYERLGQVIANNTRPVLPLDTLNLAQQQRQVVVTQATL